MCRRFESTGKSLKVNLVRWGKGTVLEPLRRWSGNLLRAQTSTVHML